MRAILNHLLKQQPHLAAQLQAFAGQQVALSLPMLNSQSTINADGYLAPPTEADADALIIVHLSIVPSLLQKQSPASGQIEILGNSALGSAFARILQQLNWDAADDLSPIFGDILANRIVQTCKSIFNWQKETAASASRTLADYAQHEAAWLANMAEVQTFCQAVDTLRDDAARLEKRLQRLETQNPTPLPAKDDICV